MNGLRETKLWTGSQCFAYLRIWGLFFFICNILFSQIKPREVKTSLRMRLVVVFIKRPQKSVAFWAPSVDILRHINEYSGISRQLFSSVPSKEQFLPSAQRFCVFSSLQGEGAWKFMSHLFAWRQRWIWIGECCVFFYAAKIFLLAGGILSRI